MSPNFDTGFAKFYGKTTPANTSSGSVGKNIVIGIIAGFATAVIFYHIGYNKGLSKMYRLMLAQSAEQNNSLKNKEVT